MTLLPDALTEHPDQEPEPDQPCLVDGVPENLHATLSRTCVVGTEGQRRLVRHDQVVVADSGVCWRPKPIEGSRRWRETRAAANRGRERARAVVEPGVPETA
jgi:hypothetical protein